MAFTVCVDKTVGVYRHVYIDGEQASDSDNSLDTPCDYADIYVVDGDTSSAHNIIVCIYELRGAQCHVHVLFREYV